MLVQLVQHDVRVGATAQVDHQAHSAAATRLVLEVGHVLDAALPVELGDLLGKAGLVHHVRELRDDQAGPVLMPLFD